MFATDSQIIDEEKKILFKDETYKIIGLCMEVLSLSYYSIIKQICEFVAK
jgi:hypothetical protein